MQHINWPSFIIKLSLSFPFLFPISLYPSHLLLLSLACQFSPSLPPSSSLSLHSHFHSLSHSHCLFNLLFKLIPTDICILTLTLTFTYILMCNSLLLLILTLLLRSLSLACPCSRLLLYSRSCSRLLQLISLLTLNSSLILSPTLSITISITLILNLISIASGFLI